MLDSNDLKILNITQTLDSKNADSINSNAVQNLDSKKNIESKMQDSNDSQTLNITQDTEFNPLDSKGNTESNLQDSNKNKNITQKFKNSQNLDSIESSALESNKSFKPNITQNLDSKVIESKKPLVLLIIALVFNISLLCYFKYMDFFIESFNALFHTNLPLLKIILPLGISFFTITQIAYLVDCYLGRAVERNIINYALFVTFFPHLIAGPILHHAEMMPQFSLLRNKILRYDNIARGLFIFSIGLFKKVFIADSFAKWANAGYSALDSGIALNIFEAWATSLSYTFQLYFDFSGYCDMAIGLGLLFNIALPINFASPYKSLNIAEFWRRWHITLGRFLRDYIYIPLGGNRNFKVDSIESSLKKDNFRADSKSILNKILTLRNLFIVAFISGIWHGAGLGFIIWGILHGLAMCLHRIYRYLLETFFNIRLKDSKINVNYLDSNADTNARNLPYSPVLTTPAHPTHLEKIAQENRANFSQNKESTLQDSINSNNSQNLDSKNIESKITESNTTQNLDSTNAQNIESKTQDSKETAESSGRAGNGMQSETLRQISTNQTLKTDSKDSKITESNTTQKLDSNNLDSTNSQNIESTENKTDSIESKNSQNLDSKDSKITESTLQDSIKSSSSQNLDSTNAQNIESKTQDSKETAESSGRAGNEIQSESLSQISTNQTLKTDFIESKNLEKLDSKQITDSIKNTESNTLQNLDSIKNTESTPQKSPKIKAFLESKIYKILCWFLTFNFINITWIFFRADSLEHAWRLLRYMCRFARPNLHGKWYKSGVIFENILEFRILVLYILLAFLICIFAKNSIVLSQKISNKKMFASAVLFVLCVWQILYLSKPPTFLYFNF